MAVIIGSLFSGIGGLELGLEMAGLGPTLWQVEQSEYCRTVLAKHWPHAERFTDVRTVGAATLAPVWLICGGFPCQDVSSAGKGAGLAGERSGLWREFARIVGEMRPRWVVVENVASGARRWVDAVVCELGRLGYEALPVPLSAADVGAPHLRQRVFIIARAAAGKSAGCARSRDCSLARRPAPANAAITRLQRPDAEGAVNTWRAARRTWAENELPQPALCRVADGATAWLGRSERIAALGNAVMPRMGEVIGHMVLEIERSWSA